MHLTNSDDFKLFLITVVRKAGMLDWEPVTLPDGSELSSEEFRLFVQDTLSTMVTESAKAFGFDKAIAAHGHHVTMDEVRRWHLIAVEMPAQGKGPHPHEQHRINQEIAAREAAERASRQASAKAAAGSAGDRQVGNVNPAPVVGVGCLLVLGVLAVVCLGLAMGPFVAGFLDGASNQSLTPLEQDITDTQGRAYALERELRDRNASLRNAQRELQEKKTELNRLGLPNLNQVPDFNKPAPNVVDWSDNPRSAADYNRAVDEHNALVVWHNQALAEFEARQATYMEIVSYLNARIDEQNALVDRGQGQKRYARWSVVSFGDWSPNDGFR